MSIDSLTIQEATKADISDMISLWLATDNICVPETKNYSVVISRFLERNSGLSFIARDNSNSKLVGTLLAGTDGMYGTFRHAVVVKECRGSGIIDLLFEASFAGFVSYGVTEFFLYVLGGNEFGMKCFVKRGWQQVTGVNAFYKRT